MMRQQVYDLSKKFRGHLEFSFYKEQHGRKILTQPEKHLIEPLRQKQVVWLPGKAMRLSENMYYNKINPPLVFL